jgi:hypothetical protein
MVASIVTLESFSIKTTNPFVCEELFDSSSITTILGIEQLEIRTEKVINSKIFFI